MFVRSIFQNLNKNFKFHHINLVKMSTAHGDTTPSKIDYPKSVNKLGSPGISLDSALYEKFISMYPEIIQEFISKSPDKELQEARERFEKVCYYTGTNREMYVAPALLNAYKCLTQNKQLTEEDINLACYLAWCFEMALTGHVLIDDVLDGHEIRWKKPSLYTKIGMKVTLEIRQFHTSGFILLKTYFKDHPSYSMLLKLFAESMILTFLGQSVDSNTALNFKNNRSLEFISMKTFLTIAKYKTASVTIRQPVLAALYLYNCNKQKRFVDLLYKFGLHFQVMNDMWDCYGKYDTLGKIATDIQEGKCTWLSSTAVESANQEQLDLLQKHYGKDDQNCQEIIRNIYEDIGILEKYRQYKFKLLDQLNKEMNSIPNPDLQNLIQSLIDSFVDIDDGLCNV